MKWSHYEIRRAWEFESWYSNIKILGPVSIKASINKSISYSYKARVVITNTWQDNIVLGEREAIESLEEAQDYCEDVIAEIAQNIYAELGKSNVRR